MWSGRAASIRQKRLNEENEIVVGHCHDFANNSPGDCETGDVRRNKVEGSRWFALGRTVVSITYRGFQEALLALRR